MFPACIDLHMAWKMWTVLFVHFAEKIGGKLATCAAVNLSLAKLASWEQTVCAIFPLVH